MFDSEDEAKASGAMKTVEVSLSRKVQGQIQELEKRLAEQRELLVLLEKHPDLERAFTLLRSLGTRY